jgi:hypothetical protein
MITEGTALHSVPVRMCSSIGKLDVLCQLRLGNPNLCSEDISQITSASITQMRSSRPGRRYSIKIPPEPLELPYVYP